MDEHLHYEVGVAGERVIARARIGPLASVIADAPRPASNVAVVVETNPHVLGPDTVTLSFEDATGRVTVLAEVDGRFLSTEVATRFLGRVIGIYAVGGQAAFDWFDYEELQTPKTTGSAPT